MTCERSGWWNWPDGAAWRWALKVSERLRRRRYELFVRLCGAGPADRILDVGVSAASTGSGNALLRWYPQPENLTACGIESEPQICRERNIRFVRADGCDLPFEDGSFDIAHSNAVIEHVGSRENQGRFVAEMVRVARRVWIATPDAASPLEPHTLLPMVHWLPEDLRNHVYRLAGRAWCAERDNLNPLDASALRALFPQSVRMSVRMHTQRLAGLPVIVAAYIES